MAGQFINTQYFREEAIYYEKHGRYDDGEYGSKYWQEYWDVQEFRCLNGYTVGDVTITGRHYFHLNFSRMATVSSEFKNGKKIVSRDVTFPFFWDEDYNYYWVLEIAKNGILKEDYLKLNLDIEIREDCLKGGKHVIWLKPRGVGASYKAGSGCAYNYHLMKDSRTNCLASTKQYLTVDGLLNKFLDVRDFINNYRYNPITKVGSHGFYQSKIKGDMESMHFISGRLGSDGTSIVGGKKAEIIGVNLNGDVQKARGKRSLQVYFEEFGSFKDADVAWNIAIPSVEQEGDVFGTLIAFGTGGTEGEGFAAMEKMFYDPDTYNCIAINNKWDDGALGTFCSYFTPAYKAVGFMDSEGNSNQVKAREFYESKRKIAEKSPDGSDILRAKAEKPFCPREAVLITDGNPFLSAELLEHINELKAKRLRNGGVLGIPVNLQYGNEGVKHIMNTELKPIPNFPITKDDTSRMNLDGCVMIYDLPYIDLKTKKTPPNLYIICHDPYAHDNSLDKANMSLGATYVIERINNITKSKGDIIVASYVGRPKSIEEYNENLFKLAQFYNAKIGAENNTGDVWGFAKRNKLLQYVEPQFSVGYDPKIATKAGMIRSHGMHMTGDRKKVGLLYLKDWLYHVRGTDELTGKVIYTFHTIEDIALLEEFAKYNDVGNFDRISALLVGMYQDKEYIYQNKKPENNSSTIADFYLTLQSSFGSVFK